MASRDLTAAFVTAVTALELRPAVFLELEYDETTLRLWDGVGPISWNGEVWTGAGNMLGIQAAEETKELEASNAVFELNGVPESLISIALNHAAEGRGRPARVWFGLLTLESTAGSHSAAHSSAFAVYKPENAVIADPVRIFSGKMDVPTIQDDPARPVIQLTAENDLVALNRARNRRWTHEDQQIDYPGDLGFEGLARQQDTPFVWGGG